MLIIKYIIHFSETHEKVEKFLIKMRCPRKRASHSFIPEKSQRTLFKSAGDGTSTSSVGNPMKKMVEFMSTDPKVKNYVKLE